MQAMQRIQDDRLLLEDFMSGQAAFSESNGTGVGREIERLSGKDVRTAFKAMPGYSQPLSDKSAGFEEAGVWLLAQNEAEKSVLSEQTLFKVRRHRPGHHCTHSIFLSPSSLRLALQPHSSLGLAGWPTRTFFRLTLLPLHRFRLIPPQGGVGHHCNCRQESEKAAGQDQARRREAPDRSNARAKSEGLSSSATVRLSSTQEYSSQTTLTRRKTRLLQSQGLVVPVTTALGQATQGKARSMPKQKLRLARLLSKASSKACASRQVEIRLVGRSGRLLSSQLRRQCRKTLTVTAVALGTLHSNPAHGQ
jgi:hypothetical protein